jgi:hypothetical protein
MRRTSSLVAVGVLLALPATSAQAEPPAEIGNCVSHFTTVLAHAGVAGDVISSGARDLRPFGLNAVSQEAHATLGSCPFNPEDFLP